MALSVLCIGVLVRSSLQPHLIPTLPGAKYRYNLREAAARHASDNGYSGLWFPWQTAGTGNECDLIEFANKLEFHTGGGIALLFDRILLFTGDMAGFGHDIAAGVVAGIADFFVSRAVESKTQPGKLSIEHCVPPDEFATGFPFYSGVTDSVYTNAIAALTARIATRISGSTNASQSGAWANLAANITILTAPIPHAETHANDNIYHPEYLNYPYGNVYAHKKVKQADVTMLGYPLQWEGVAGGTELQRNDLVEYEKVYDPEGPAMTGSIHTIAWLEHNNTEMVRCLPHPSNDYHHHLVWYSILTRNAVFFNRLNFGSSTRRLTSIHHSLFGLKARALISTNLSKMKDVSNL